MHDHDRMRRGGGGESQDWASQVPWHYGRRGPYEDYGWERGESVLPEFRDPSVHEMPYDRERFSYGGPRDAERQSRPGSQMDAQRRSMMRNPYDEEYGYDRSRYGRASMGREYDEDRMRSGSYGRDYDEGRWRAGGQGYAGGYEYDRMRAGGQGSYGGMYNRDYAGYGRGYDEDRWRSGGQGSYGGMYNRDYGRDYDEGRWRAGGQGYAGGYEYDRMRSGGQGSYGGMYNRDYGRDYNEDRWRSGSSYGSSSSPMTWTYTEYWLIPGPYTGRGPQGYQRSDERIKEDICERMTQHGQLDASEIQIDVKNCDVTLRGAVDSRQAKRMAEDAAESVSGVREVQNELRVRHDQQGMSSQQDMSGQNQSSQGSQQRELGGTQNRS